LKGRDVRQAFRAAFMLYVPALFIATHWPKLELPAAGRPDLFIHIVAFGLWTALLIGAGFFGPALSRRNIRVAGVIGIIWAGFDEATQAIGFINRHAAWDDFAANVGGVLLSCSASLLLMKVVRARSARGPGPVNTAAEHHVSR
jgi:hypothetical protein